MKLGQISLESRRADRAIVLQAASTMPTGLASYLPDKPTTLQEAKVSPSGRNGAACSSARLAARLRVVCGRSSIDPEKKPHSAPRPFSERKVGQVGRVETYKCRIVAQGFRQIKGIHYQESSSPLPYPFASPISQFNRSTHT